MAVEFKIQPHSVTPGLEIVEILVDGEMVGGIYPYGEKGIKVVSAHFTEIETDEGFDGEVVIDSGKSSWPPIPSVLITLDPQAWYIAGGEIKKVREAGHGSGDSPEGSSSSL